MSDWSPYLVWSADYIQDGFQIYAGDIRGLRALVLLELNEEGKHVPFVYPDDERGSIYYESLVSSSLTLNNHNYNVIKGMYHEDIIDELSNTIEASPFEHYDITLEKPPHENIYWANGADSYDLWCYEFEDSNKELFDVAMAGNCYVADFFLPRFQRGFDAHRKEEIFFSISRVVYTDGRWDTMGMGNSETSSFSGSTYVEPKILNTIKSSWIIVTENAMGVGAIIVVLLFLAVLGILKRKRHTKESSVE